MVYAEKDSERGGRGGKGGDIIRACNHHHIIHVRPFAIVPCQQKGDRKPLGTVRSTLESAIIRQCLADCLSALLSISAGVLSRGWESV
jgi:hypothetical protein